jgi:hypothetical protein
VTLPSRWLASCEAGVCCLFCRAGPALYMGIALYNPTCPYPTLHVDGSLHAQPVCAAFFVGLALPYIYGYGPCIGTIRIWFPVCPTKRLEL